MLPLESIVSRDPLRQGQRCCRPDLRSKYDQIWLMDWEYVCPPGERPDPVCLVALEVLSGQVLRLWKDQLQQLRAAPFAVDSRSLVAAYFGTGDLQCFKAFGWHLPANYLDLYVEFRSLTNGLVRNPSLVAALNMIGVPFMEGSHKDAMRDLVLRGSPYSATEIEAILEYCEEDTYGAKTLFEFLEAEIDIDRALLRGEYIKCAAEIEFRGIPIDLEAYERLKAHWPRIPGRLIREIDASLGVFEGARFSQRRLRAVADRLGVEWPTTPSGRLKTSVGTIAAIGSEHPEIMPLAVLMQTLGQLRLGYPLWDQMGATDVCSRRSEPKREETYPVHPSMCSAWRHGCAGSFSRIQVTHWCIWIGSSRNLASRLSLVMTIACCEPTSRVIRTWRSRSRLEPSQWMPRRHRLDVSETISRHAPLQSSIGWDLIRWRQESVDRHRTLCDSLKRTGETSRSSGAGRSGS